MRYFLILTALMISVVAQSIYSVPIFAWDSNGAIVTDTSKIDSVVVANTSLGDTTYQTYTILGGALYIDLSTTFRDSICAYAVYYDTASVDFAAGGWYIPIDDYKADTVQADVYAISGDAGAADSAELYFDGTGIPLKLDRLIIHSATATACSISSGAENALNIVTTAADKYGAYIYGDGAAIYGYGVDVGLKIYGYSLGADISSPYGRGMDITSDVSAGLYLAGDHKGLYCVGDSAGIYASGGWTGDGIYSAGARGATLAGIAAGLRLDGQYGVYNRATGIGNYIIATVGIAIDSSTIGILVNADSLGGYFADSRYVNMRIDYTDTLGDPALDDIDSLLDGITLDTTGLAREATVTAARDSILTIGNADWITSDGDTNLFDFAAARDSIITVGDANWTTATGFATPANVVSALDSIISNGNIKWTTADSTYLLGGVNVVSPYAYASNRVRLENLNTPIKWAQAEQDTIKWDIDTSLALSTFDSVIVVFRAWKSRTDTTTIIYDTCAVDTVNNTAALYISSGETDTLTSGNYPADLWLERYSGLIILKTQIWNKTIQIDRSSRGSR